MSVAAVEVLRGLALFGRLSEEGLAAVAERVVFRTVSRDTLLFRQGEAYRGMYVVVRGTVRVYRASADGREQVLHTQGPGQAVAEVPLFDGGPYPASARVMEDGRVLFLPVDAFQWLYRTHPEIADATIRELGGRLRRMVRLVEKISLRDVPSRVALTLLEYAEGGAGGCGSSFELPRTQEELACELATTRESVSRALSRLRRDGLIERRGSRIRILDRAGLAGFAASAGERQA